MLASSLIRHCRASFSKVATAAAAAAKKKPAQPAVSADRVYQAAVDYRHALRREKEAQLAMINAEIAAAGEGSASANDLITQRDTIEKELAGKDFDLAFEQLYLDNKIEDVPMFLFRDMPNSLYRKHHGRELVARLAKYYHIYGDTLPSSWYDQFRQATDAINLVVNYDPKSRDASVDYAGLKPVDKATNAAAILQNREFLVSRGNMIIPDNTTSMPDIRFHIDENETEKLFSLIMFDAGNQIITRWIHLTVLDVPLPSEQTMLSMPQYFAINIPASQSGCDMAKASTVLSYIPPHPQQGTGAHRYTWLLLEQNESVPIDKNQIMKLMNESKWNSVDLLEKHADWDAEKLWKPRGMVFHRAGWTPAVTELYTSNKIFEPKHVVDGAASLETEVETEDGRVQVSHEPIFGKVIERDWHQVTQRLYRYAFK